MDAAHRLVGGRKLDDFEAVPSRSVVGVADDDLKTVFDRVVLCDRRL